MSNISSNFLQAFFNPTSQNSALSGQISNQNGLENLGFESGNNIFENSGFENSGFNGSNVGFGNDFSGSNSLGSFGNFGESSGSNGFGNFGDFSGSGNFGNFGNSGESWFPQQGYSSGTSSSNVSQALQLVQGDLQNLSSDLSTLTQALQGSSSNGLCGSGEYGGYNSGNCFPSYPTCGDSFGNEGCSPFQNGCSTGGEYPEEPISDPLEPEEPISIAPFDPSGSSLLGESSLDSQNLDLEPNELSSLLYPSSNSDSSVLTSSLLDPYSNSDISSLI